MITTALLVLGAAGAILAEFGVVHRWAKPLVAWKRKVDEVLHKNTATVTEVAQRQEAMMVATIAMLKHLEEGNNTGRMSEARDKLTATLIFDDKK